MDPQTAAALLNPDVLAVLDSIEYSRAEEMQTQQRLRKQGLAPEVAAAVMTQAQLRVEARSKFGPFADSMLFTRDGLGQATRLPVAAMHAKRMHRGEPGLIADLGCGIGADALAFAGMGEASVYACDADEVTAALAAYNLRPFDAVAEHARAEDFDLARADALWLDPARRRGTNADGSAFRLSDPEAFSPSLSWAFAAAERVPSVGIKLGPALDHSLVPDGWEAQWVSHRGDVVEVALFNGHAQEREGRAALIMGDEGSLTVTEADLPADEVPVAGVGAYLFEPDGAVIRSGLVQALCGPLGAHRIHESIAYLSGDRPAEGPVAQAVSQYRVEDVLPAGIKAVRGALAMRGINQVVIKKRGMDIDPAQVRRQLKLRPAKKGQPARSAVVIFTRVGQQRCAILAHED